MWFYVVGNVHFQHILGMVTPAHPTRKPNTRPLQKKKQHPVTIIVFLDFQRTPGKNLKIWFIRVYQFIQWENETFAAPTLSHQWSLCPRPCEDRGWTPRVRGAVPSRVALEDATSFHGPSLMNNLDSDFSLQSLRPFLFVFRICLKDQLSCFPTSYDVAQKHVYNNTTWHLSCRNAQQKKISCWIARGVCYHTINPRCASCSGSPWLWCGAAFKKRCVEKVDIWISMIFDWRFDP